MQLDAELAAVVDDLLRTDTRLLPAAALLGRVAVVVTEPKPERKPRKATPKKRPPPRADSAAEPQPAPDLDEEAAKPLGAPWLKVARARPVSDAIRAAIGGQWLAVVTVDGGLWGKLRSEDQRRALALALRGLRHEEREDGSDKVAREAPPLQCWPDTADDLSHLVAALGEDGAAGAAAVSAAESLTEEQRTDRATIKPGFLGWACNLIRDLRAALAEADLREDVGDAADEVDALEHWLKVRPELARRVREALGEDDEPLSAGHFIHDEDGGPEENEGQS